MGGPGAGHKSERVRRARLENIQKARAARKREPLAWRSGLESRIIEQLVWQWWVLDAGGWKLEAGERSACAAAPLRRDLPMHGYGSASLRQGYGSASKPATAGKPWAKYRVARFLGVSHTWVNKLVKRFEADPERMRRRMAAFAPASFEKLERAREETRRQREYGWLRGGIRWRRVKFMHEGKRRTAVAATESERRRREAEAKGRPEGPLVVPYAELPTWARSVSLPGGAGVAARVRPRRFFRR
jgi:hypothetical protein